MEYNVNKYIEFLLEENERQNLVSRKSLSQETEKHIEDSLELLNIVDLTGKSLIDIGSGAGFPALILALKCPKTRFTLVESDQKKSSFLNRVKSELNLDHVQILNQRVEEVGRDTIFRETFDFCTCRAVAVMNILLEYAFPLLNQGGSLIMWKGVNYFEEITASYNALDVLQGEVVKAHLYSLMEQWDRVLLVVRKKALTPDKYPRRVGIPSKRPL